MAPVKPRRDYHSTRRTEQARATRQAVLAAGRHAFLTTGYGATTMSAIAHSAKVSVETIYKMVGNKPALAKAVFDVDIAGDDEPIPLMQREFVQRNMAETDPRRKLESYGQHLAIVGPRTGPLLLVVRDAASTDAGAAGVWQQLQAERLVGMTVFAQHLHDGGYLRQGVSPDEARDVLWTHNSVELWDLLVNQRGWTAARFGTWVGEQLCAALLDRPV